MKKIIDRTIYNTETAQEVCSNGIINQGGCTRCTELYKTKKGNFFFYNRTMWQGESNSIQPVTKDGAISFFERCDDITVEFEEAFPGIELNEA